ncbi:MAG: prepilin peptidase, partial [Syntrophobacterales bacterium]
MRRDLSDWPAADYFLRPERKERRRTILDRMAWELAGFVVQPARVHLSGLNGIVANVERYDSVFKGKGDGDLRMLAGFLRQRLRREGLVEGLVAETFALIREAARRTVGMGHFDCQLIGGAALLRGFLAEMDTGEGKTLVATLPAALVALAGVPVHIISVNDYLTSRDAEWMGEIYRFLGLTVGCIVHEKTVAQRREAYLCDVTYCTNKEIVFDYLRDRITLADRTDPLRLYAECIYKPEGRSHGLLLRGLHYAIVDEADSVLVDEARTPLIISKTEASEEEEIAARQALDIAHNLKEGTHYRIEYEADDGLRTIVVTDSGRARIAKMTELFGVMWRSSVRQEELIRKALMALLLFCRDEQYLVRDGKVQIIDEFTGRVMPDRSWEGGLHQLIETKEGCEITGQRGTVARISYQRFFRKYLKLSGMTGTAKEVRREVWAIYGLSFVRIPTNRPVRRRSQPDRIFGSAEDKW